MFPPFCRPPSSSSSESNKIPAAPSGGGFFCFLSHIVHRPQHPLGDHLSQAVGILGVADHVALDSHIDRDARSAHPPGYVVGDDLGAAGQIQDLDRKSTRLNSSH